MTSYQITQYTKKQAKKLGVTVKQAKRKDKKIDVFKDGKKVASIGALGYQDYPTYIKTKGIQYANKRRKLYQMRHRGEQRAVGSPGYYAWYLLW